mgnify:CR=1 FL=1
MIGAIIGDIVGSRFEWDTHRSKDFTLKAVHKEQHTIRSTVRTRVLEEQEPIENALLLFGHLAFTIQHISSAREAVARMLKSFSEDGLVELKRGAITLRDTDGLNHLK